jgi:hypothetical protein
MVKESTLKECKYKSSKNLLGERRKKVREKV